VFRRSVPKAPKIGSVQIAMLMIINPPHTRARTLITVPQPPRLKIASLCGQPRRRAANTPRLQRKYAM
jgi:hypothetical protein